MLHFVSFFSVFFNVQCTSHPLLFLPPPLLLLCPIVVLLPFPPLFLLELILHFFPSINLPLHQSFNWQAGVLTWKGSLKRFQYHRNIQMCTRQAHFQSITLSLQHWSCWGAVTTLHFAFSEVVSLPARHRSWVFHAHLNCSLFSALVKLGSAARLLERIYRKAHSCGSL